MIKSKVCEKNELELKEKIKSYKKIDDSTIAGEQFGEHSYLREMNIPMGRTFLASRAGMLKTVQMNFKRREDYAANMYKCTCGEDDFTSHLIYCPSYMFLQEGLSVRESDHDLVKFYMLVIREREKEEEQQESRR